MMVHRFQGCPCGYALEQQRTTRFGSVNRRVGGKKTELRYRHERQSGTISITHFQDSHCRCCCRRYNRNKRQRSTWKFKFYHLFTYLTSLSDFKRSVFGRWRHFKFCNSIVRPRSPLVITTEHVSAKRNITNRQKHNYDKLWCKEKNKINYFNLRNRRRMFIQYACSVWGNPINVLTCILCYWSENQLIKCLIKARTSSWNA